MYLFRETIGTLGSLIVLISMCFKTDTLKGSLIMRVLNLLGSIIFVYYGFMITGYSVIALNGILAIVNIYYIIDLVLKNKS